MLKSSDYLNLVKKRGQERKQLKKISKWIRNPHILTMAYLNLYPNEGAMTNGTDSEDTIDGMSLDRIAELSKKLENNTFEWKPCNRLHLPKKDGSTNRPLGIPNGSDKMVQEAMRIILAAYYEPQFSNLSHGFRNGRGCHTAFTQIFRAGGWTGTKWFIEGDIKGCFNNINHDKLLEIVGKNVVDFRFNLLLRDLLEAGYLEDWKYNQTYSGTPQGGIVSPLLANIYLNELDTYIENELIPQYTRGKFRAENKEYKSLTHKIRKRVNRGNIDEAKRLKAERNKLPCGDPNDPVYRRLRYIRYADDFLLGYIGTKEEAAEIKDKLRTFINEKLGMELSDNKTLISHAGTSSARFLSYEIKVPIVNSKVVKDSDERRKRALNKKPQFRMPDDVYKNWISKYKEGGKVKKRTELINDSDYDIVMTYKMELLGIYNYYRMAVNVSRLWNVKAAAYWSLVHTIADKHKSKCINVLKKYGAKKVKNGKVIKCIEVVVERKDKNPLRACFGDVDIKYDNTPTEIPDYVVKVWSNRTQLLQRMRARKCELCDTTEDKFEVHHIKKLKDLAKKWQGKKEKPLWVQKMIAMRRKTIVLCTKCHNDVHSGRYDGKKLGS
jgi:group II intron reverse transcriptase/maturase